MFELTIVSKVFPDLDIIKFNVFFIFMKIQIVTIVKKNFFNFFIKKTIY